MKNSLLLLLLALALTQCKNSNSTTQQVVTTDIHNFWEAFDLITATNDSATQYQYLDSLFIQRGTPGLQGVMQARNYSPQEYLYAINHYPKFWASIRPNMQLADELSGELQGGFEKFREVYPDLKPAKIYFTVGAFRTGGTTIDSTVMIGSEISLADSSTVTSEFPENLAHLKTHFATNPNKHLIFSNVHEYVHTQQNPRVFNILSLTIYEGVAEFVAHKALGIPSPIPQIEFGKKHAQRIREVYETEMFYNNLLYKWLDGSAPNEFGMRDLGYYVGYQICENYYEQATDKAQAIKTMIELDYTDEAAVDDFVTKSGYFSATLDELYQNFETKRPTVTGIQQFENHSTNVSPSISEITVNFSEPLNGHHTGVDFGDLGQEAFPKGDPQARSWGADNLSWTLSVEFEPNRKYQILISNNFRTAQDVPLKAYLIEFTTDAE